MDELALMGQPGGAEPVSTVTGGLVVAGCGARDTRIRVRTTKDRGWQCGGRDRNREGGPGSRWDRRAQGLGRGWGFQRLEASKGKGCWGTVTHRFGPSSF